MKLRGPIFFSVLLLTLLAAAFYPKMDNAEKDAVLMRAILTFFGQLHYQPKQMNDDFSQKLYTLYLDRIDGGRRFLTQEDIKRMEQYKTQLDNEAQNGTFAFFDLSLELLSNGMKKTQGYYREALAKPFDFTVDESIELDSEKRSFVKNDKELKDYWRRYIKYEVMTRVSDDLEKQKNMGEEGSRKSQEDLEAQARKDVLKPMDDWYDTMNKLKRSTRLSYYLNTITNLYDPHSDYLEPIDKQNFDIRFSGRLEGIGARLQNDGDYTKVSEVVVGGPAWKTKELQDGDIITKVAQGKNGEWKDVTGMQLDDVVQLIRGEKGTEVRLTIKKKVDNTLDEISIIRDIVIFEEGFAKSLILDGTQPDEKIGYIYLPRFYADFDHPDGRFSGKDIGIEIEKLKAEKVDGIILDLRNNGGGSLNDVVQMSGFFIEQGPIVQVKSKSQNPDVLDDNDPRVQYDGALIVMVNHFSASASEILAAALQDYGRAVIVGTNTYGKGTVQRFYDLDRGVKGFEDLKPLGEVKLTVQKFYRVNGGSTQLRGVTPDIILPDNFSYMEVGEKEEDYPLEWTEIPSLQYKQNVYKLSNLSKVKAESEKRVAKDPTFQKIVQGAQRIKQQSKETSFPLKLDAFIAVSEKQKLETKEYEGLFKDSVNKGVKNLEVDLPSVHGDDAKKTRNETFVQSVAKDVYIHETLNIIHDLVKKN